MAATPRPLQVCIQSESADMAAPDEQTPLLESNCAAETPKSQLQASKNDDEESSHVSLDSKDDPKSSAGLLGIILVLLLGKLISARGSSR